MVKFRWHRGSLAESMKTVVEVPDFQALRTLLQEGMMFNPVIDTVTISYQMYDERIRWNSYIVCVNGNAVGYTNGTFDHRIKP